MNEVGCLAIFVVAVIAAVALLRAKDRFTGEGRGAVSEGMKEYETKRDAGRLACPHCAEMIMPAAKICPFCKLEVSK